MINKVLRIIAPHYCYGCAKIGTTLCENCKYDIVDEAVDVCMVCAQPSSVGICKLCHTSYDRAWFVGERSDILERIINAYKFERVIDASNSFASLLDMRLPVLPPDIIVIPVPTIAPHVRQRGYDHTARIAKLFGAHRNLAVRAVLRRRDSHMQRGRNKKDRFAQAETAFYCDSPLDPQAIYLLIDDVVTTNATVRYAASALREAGATTVWVAVLARQPLDKVV